jgi:hypothetical protein
MATIRGIANRVQKPYTLRYKDTPRNPGPNAVGGRLDSSLPSRGLPGASE